MYQKIKDLSKGIYTEIVEIRRELHRHPELSNEEYYTAEVIKKFLQKNDIEYEQLGDGTGILGLIRGHKQGKTLAIRADMDALPIEEETDLEYKSKIKNVMHACGHDVHVATVLGAAFVLKQLQSEFSGNIKFIFQPAEEGGLGGYKTIYEAVYPIHNSKFAVDEKSLEIGTNVISAFAIDFLKEDGYDDNYL